MNFFLVIVVVYLIGAALAFLVALGLAVYMIYDWWRERTAGARIVRLFNEHPLTFDDPTPIEPIAQEHAGGLRDPEANQLMRDRVQQWRRWHSDERH